ncbi:transcriptional regulator [Paenibacillus sp. VTT E-133280]|uniref:Winged helix-turn-helix transcriptional regulator n=4 Tax=Bacteria TaxID=2 RepID=A0A7Z2VSW1_9BACL|nr:MULTISPECIES: metalloregulator ArsR/SmtB family transcription factor [Paenibacillaceae]UUZ78805.1 metalloregulator ArsR/SmtB family transcription factor [Paenibacillus sp. P26]UUZ95086.1 metalloregulator ArsR/SmtB family transcription factor [Paenibacillus sp. P25]KKC47771.1 ArsR family transcriptional regulator [Paenibacillus sp. D9]MCK8487488.1 metalloregulator ArsR/SmtB family transcription factor [Paenibacillus mellifer]MCT1400935.1 metalloregulator ArsR/SmtB family transcription factor
MSKLEEVADALKLLGDRNRLTIVALLQVKELCVCEIVDILKTSQPNISQHMRKLRDGGLVKESRRGQWVYYSLCLEDKPYILDILKEIPSQAALIEPAVCETNDCCT